MLLTSSEFVLKADIDDDVVAFMLLGQTDPQLCIIHQRHIVLQHLSIKPAQSFSLVIGCPVCFHEQFQKGWIQVHPFYLWGGRVFLQDVNDALKTKWWFLPGEAEPLPAGEQSVYV